MSVAETKVQEILHPLSNEDFARAAAVVDKPYRDVFGKNLPTPLLAGRDPLVPSLRLQFADEPVRAADLEEAADYWKADVSVDNEGGSAVARWQPNASTDEMLERLKDPLRGIAPQHIAPVHKEANLHRRQHGLISSLRALGVGDAAEYVTKSGHTVRIEPLDAEELNEVFDAALHLARGSRGLNARTVADVRQTAAAYRHAYETLRKHPLTKNDPEWVSLYQWIARDTYRALVHRFSPGVLEEAGVRIPAIFDDGSL